jgi:restriction system protein
VLCFVLSFENADQPIARSDLPDVETESELDPYAQINDLALERIKDRIAQLDWEQMQALVAALLRALGYRTQISARGPDRGRDILATTDGFGFRPPRIFVEVKHRTTTAIGAPDVRAMPVGSHADDRGLYVSTGGFTREAYYEAERGQKPVSLMTLDDLTRAILDAYPNFDEEGRALLPLRRLYWPMD